MELKVGQRVKRGTGEVGTVKPDPSVPGQFFVALDNGLGFFVEGNGRALRQDSSLQLNVIEILSEPEPSWESQLEVTERDGLMYQMGVNIALTLECDIIEYQEFLRGYLTNASEKNIVPCTKLAIEIARDAGYKHGIDYEALDATD